MCCERIGRYGPERYLIAGWVGIVCRGSVSMMNKRTSFDIKHALKFQTLFSQDSRLERRSPPIARSESAGR